MSSVVLCETYRPLPVQLLSSVVASVHYLESVLVILILAAIPSLTPKAPPALKIRRTRVVMKKNRSIESFQSMATTSTYVNEEFMADGEELAEIELTKNKKRRRTTKASRAVKTGARKLGNTLSKMSAPIEAAGKSLKPAARRMSLPAAKVADAIAHPRRFSIQEAFSLRSDQSKTADGALAAETDSESLHPISDGIVE